MKTAIELNAQFTGLKARAEQAAYKLQATIPVSNLPTDAQEAFLFAFSDLKLLEQLLETAENTMNAIALQEQVPDNESDDADLFSGLADLLSQLVDTLFDQFGVSKDLILPTVTKDMARQLELIETILKRCEDSVAQIKA